MRIVRYELELVDYQQLQPLWPGRILSVAPGRLIDHRTGLEIPYAHRDQKIDMWALDNDAVRDPATQPAPILGVWIIGTGHPMPTRDEHFAEAIFHGTCVMANALVWHVFTAVIGAAEVPEDAPEYSSVDDMAEQIRRRHAERKFKS